MTERQSYQDLAARVEGDAVQVTAATGPAGVQMIGVSLPLGRASVATRAIVDRTTLHIAAWGWAWR